MVNKKLTDKAKEDLILVKSALDNTDARAFSKLLSKYRDPIYFKLLEMLNDKELAQELTIESFGKAFNNLSTYSSTYAFSTWLFSIAKNHCIDFLRKKKNRTVSIDDLIDQEDGNSLHIDIKDQKPAPDDYLIKKQRIQFLRNLVDQLDPKYRLLVRLRYFKELSYDEIARELNLPLGTVKAQLHRSREYLFKLLSGKKDII